MTRAIHLAKNALGTSFPNPMVGCVIVHNGCIIGEGFTSPYGGPHAEVNAINSVRDKALLPYATLYVTLEPCSHHGKTPPCVDLILEHEIPKVVVGITDPNPQVSGTGIEKLERAGCTVTVGVMHEACREHHRRFLTYQEKERPYVILKWAETADGFIAPNHENRNLNDQGTEMTPKPFWITNTNSRQLVHKWRTEEQAILVGTRTVLLDNPRLNARTWEGEHPLRVFIDRQLKTPSTYNVLDGSIPTLVFTEITDSAAYVNGIDYKVLDYSKNLVPQIVTILYQRKVSSILVEGGTQTLQSFIDIDLWDEARVFSSPVVFDSGTKGPSFKGTVQYMRKINSDALTIYRNA